MSEKLEPTLWRSCRALANRNRLLLLRAMIDEPPLCVQTLSERCKLKKSVCSQYLRILNARGFTQVSRIGRWVDYALGANPSVRNASVILQAVTQTVKGYTLAKQYDPVLKDLTLFTCPRRIRIVRTLHRNQEITPSALARLCSMPRRTLLRQLKKLERREVIARDESFVTLRTPARHLAKVLLKIALEKSE
jgi:DNA-binding transcriptional ArsR family regulator